MSKQTYASSSSEGGKLGSVLQRGNGLGNYTTTSLSYVAIDNGMNFTIMVPQGYVAIISFAGVATIATAADSVWVAIQDVLADGSGSSGILSEQQINVSTVSATAGIGFGVQALIVGDNRFHTIVPVFKANNASHAGQILNNSLTHAPTMLVELTQSNLN